MENINCHYQYNPPTWLPPGFRFHPTDEELITCYLARKVADESFRDHAVTEVDLNKHEPWDLPGKAQMMGDKQWYFFSRKDKKYPSGSRTNRATEAGYWKATGKDKEVFMKSRRSNGRKQQLVGMKKTLVFYEGRAPRGVKSNWVMHEYRIDGHASIASILGNTSFSKLQKEEWVICRVFCKKLRHSKRDLINDADLLARFLLADDQQLPQLPLNLATPLSLAAGTDSLAAAAKLGCSSSQSTAASTISSEVPSHSLTNDCFSIFPSDAPLPRFPSDLESFWLHASSFLQ